MKLLDTYAKERDEKRIRRRLRQKVKNKIKDIELILRGKRINAFEKVYIFIALEMIINELALRYDIGKVEVEEKDNILHVRVTNPSLTETDFKNILENDRKKNNIYTLLDALKEISEYEVKTNPEGRGILITVSKNLISD